MSKLVKFLILAATRQSKSMLFSKMEPSAAQPFRPAPPPASMKQSNSAMATRSASSAKAFSTAVENVNTTIAGEICGLDALEQVDIDRTLIELDGTENKAKLGANAILGVSMATARAAAEYLGVPSTNT